MRRRHVAARALAVLACAAAGVVFWCSMYPVDAVVINESGYDATDVVLITNGRSMELGSIGDRRAKRVSVEWVETSGIAIRWNDQNRAHRATVGGYLCSGGRTRGTVTIWIRADGSIAVSDRTRWLKYPYLW
jgi:hypothetical protein